MHTAPEVRQSMEIAQLLSESMIQFVPMPVLSAGDRILLIMEMGRRLDELGEDK